MIVTEEFALNQKLRIVFCVSNASSKFSRINELEKIIFTSIQAAERTRCTTEIIIVTLPFHFKIYTVTFEKCIKVCVIFVSYNTTFYPNQKLIGCHYFLPQKDY